MPSEATALALISVVAGALGVLAIATLYRRLAREEAWVLGATAIAATSPLYWFTSARPLSDAAGLSAAIAVQALTLGVGTPRGLALAAFLAGVATGIRSQIAWLTVPLILWQAGRAGRVGLTGFVGRVSRVGWVGKNTAGRVGTTAAAFLAGALVWFVPLVVLSGGPTAYWRALFDQGAEDLSGIRMLWTMPTPRVFVEALYYAFVAPWAVWWIAALVLVSAALGGWQLFNRNRPALAVLVAAFGPYLVFDIVFQETFTSRYALPLVIPIAFLCAAALRDLPESVALIAFVALAMFDAHVGGRSIAALSRQPAPVFQLLSDMQAASAAGPAPVLAPDRRQSFDLRRPLAWLADRAPAFDRQLPAPPQHEWLEAVKYWDGGGRAPVWFVVDPRRAAIDLVQHGEPAPYRWTVPYPVLLNGTRPNDADWYRVEQPDWYLGAGWSLTPETAGVAAADRRGLAFGPLTARVRRDAAGALVVGGRSFEDGAPRRLVARFGETIVIDLPVSRGDFLAAARLASPPAGPPGYLLLALSVEPPGNVAVEQFDASSTRPLAGFGPGWQEPELNPATGARWRWLSERGELRYLTSANSGAVLHIEGESPRRYFSRDSRLVIRAGESVLKDIQLSSDFTIDVPVPPAQEPSTLLLETDQTYTPAERSWRGSQDRRRLGLRIFKCEMRFAR